MRQLKTSQVCSLFFRPLAQHYPGVGDSPLVYRSSPILAEESKQVGKYRIGQVRQVRIGRCPSFFSLQKGKKAFAPPICLCCPRTSLLFFLNLSFSTSISVSTLALFYLFLLHFFTQFLQHFLKNETPFFAIFFFCAHTLGEFSIFFRTTNIRQKCSWHSG